MEQRNDLVLVFVEIICICKLIEFIKKLFKILLLFSHFGFFKFCWLQNVASLSSTLFIYDQ